MKLSNAQNAMALERGDILVLNATFQPINITSWKRAFVLILKERATVVSSKVIKLSNYVKISVQKLHMKRPSKSAIYKRDNHKCQYCGSTHKLTIDHVIPRSRGGQDTWTNLVVACSSCNTLKGDKLLEQTSLKLKRKPAPLTRVTFTIEHSSVDEWKQYVYA